MSNVQPSQVPGETEHKGISDAHQLEELQRQYTGSITEEDRIKSFEHEDARWTTRAQVGDWIKLLIMMAAYVAWCLIVYFLEPGIR